MLSLNKLKIEHTFVKKNKKIKDEDVVLIIVNETGKNRKYEIMTKDIRELNNSK